MHVSLKDNIKNNEINIILYTVYLNINLLQLHNTVILWVDFSLVDYIEIHKINIRINN